MSRHCHRTQKITFPICYRKHRAMVLHYHVGFRTCVHKSLLRMHADRRFQLSSRGKRGESWKKDCKNLALSLNFQESYNALGWFYSRWRCRALYTVRKALRIRLDTWPWTIVQEKCKSAFCVTLHRKVNETYWLIYFTQTGRSGTLLKDGWVWITPGKQEG